MKTFDAFESPGLIVYPDRVKRNIAKVIEMVDGNPARLRPHIKTHKTKEGNDLLLAAGITKFKCATIAEAELLALSEAPDVLISMQLIGPNLERFKELVAHYPKTKFSSIIDDAFAASELNRIIADLSTGVYVDLNMGMNRTGITPDKALGLIQHIQTLPNVTLRGLHAYDGHIRDKVYEDRAKHVETDFTSFYELLGQIDTSDLELVVSGTPSFLVHHKNSQFTCSPGTFIFFDAGYAALFPENTFEFGVEIIARIISKPTDSTICLDLGHKSVAAENPIDNRVRFIDHPSWVLKSQSEEHGIVEVGDNSAYTIGEIIRMIPYHICPTVNLHSHLQVIDGSLWEVKARNRRLCY
ncbi:D-TA family PLP-dependent enzyme [Aquirufa lenticrescens]|uniref:D-TA family PLP-dependent enzyme n=1 Tax=Aquirufa lenticrescens TaxID=2696560 RepID=UPI001CAA604F|nr:D-TA family PLP-dependent enzyme [Aquirufa lenticrescens]UAJ14938.1 D-TA family PLP-dependent enzyme [Aquirufa lenticrescens]